MENHELCRLLLHAETDAEVLQILKDAGYWDNPVLWRPVGDNEQNYSVIGNQQEEAVSALVEKLTNSIDAVLINRCHEEGIDPKGPDAPAGMRAALAKFFPVSDSYQPTNRALLWGDERLTRSELDALAGHVWLTVTGSRTSPSVTVADRGEGQTPDDFPKTFMALLGHQTSAGRTESQKKDIPFVQGQFNMGSSGVYMSASEPNGFQFLVSRRNPMLLPEEASARDGEWGFTVVRRTQPETGSVFEYLAPVKAETVGRWGSVLSFSADSLPLLPESPPRHQPNLAYHEEVAYGTLVKLYEYRYKTTGLSTSNVLQKNGLLRALDLALPECALPIRIVEARDYSSKKTSPGSFQTNLMGAVYRFHNMASARGDAEDTDDRSSEREEGERAKLEGAPVYGELTLQGTSIPWTAFVFREDAEDRTRNGNCSIVYQVNGQKHAHAGRDFFRRKAVGLGVLGQRNTIFVIVDCTGLSNLHRENIFKPSRDRFRVSELSRELESLVEDSLKSNHSLAALQQDQVERVQKARLAEPAPVRSVLERLIKDTPTLARLFGLGAAVRTPKPFRDGETGEGRGGGKFEGKRHPTFLRFKNGETALTQEAHVGSKSRIQFSTDAVDDYFSRSVDTGYFIPRLVGTGEEVSGGRSDLKYGAFTYSVSVPATAVPGDKVSVEFEMGDPMIDEPLVCQLVLDVREPLEPRPPGTSGARTTSNQDGGSVGGRVKLDLPDVRKCCREDPPPEGYEPWRNGWDEHTAVTLEEAGGGALTYFVNVSNRQLQEYQKRNPSKDPALLEAKFMWSLLLLAMAVVADYEKEEDSKDGLEDDDQAMKDDGSAAERRDEAVRRLTSAAAWTVFPVLDTVNSLEIDND